MHRYWIEKFHEALDPPFYLLGTSMNFDKSMVPEAEKGIQVAKDWVRSLIYNLDFVPQKSFLTNMLRLANLGLFLDPKDAPKYLFRGPFMTSVPRPDVFLQGPENRYIVSELLVCAGASDPLFLWRGINGIRWVLSARF